MIERVKTNLYSSFIIFDIDGTLANIGHRLYHIKSEKQDWDSFNDAMVDDILHRHIAEIYYRMCNIRYMNNYGSIFVTGRPETHRKMTEDWLMKHNLIPNYLFMRPAGDYRSDVEIKAEIYHKYIEPAEILFVVDDRDAVVKMWRMKGLKCLQCQKGDY